VRRFPYIRRLFRISSSDPMTLAEVITAVAVAGLAALLVDNDRASEEAAQLGLTSHALKTFASIHVGTAPPKCGGAYRERRRSLNVSPNRKS
jgi:hypothetical protein